MWTVIKTYVLKKHLKIKQTVWRILKKLKIELACDPAILLLGIDPKATKTLAQKDICTFAVTAAVSTIRHGKSKHPSADGQGGKFGIHTNIISLSYQKANPTTYNHMDGASGHYAVWTKSDRIKQVFYVIYIVESIKIKINSEKEISLMVTKVESGGGRVWRKVVKRPKLSVVR